MTPKDKAAELVNKYCRKVQIFTKQDSIPCIFYDVMTEKSAKECALIAVNETIKFISDDPYYKDFTFFEEVKEEINKL